MGEARRKKDQVCVYCDVAKGSSRDHVIPRSLFDGRNPPIMPTVPACTECHSAKSRDDELLRELLVLHASSSDAPRARRLLELVPGLPGAQGRALIHGRAPLTRKSLDRRQEIHFSSPGGLYLGGGFAIVGIEASDLHRNFTRIVRGLYFACIAKRLPQDVVFHSGTPTPEGFEQALATFDRAGTKPRCLDDVFGVLYGTAPADVAESYWLMWFYPHLLAGVPHAGFVVHVQTTRAVAQRGTDQPPAPR